MMALTRKPAGVIFLLFAVTFLTLPTYISAQSPNPCNGSWNGTVGPGTGTISRHGVSSPIITSSMVTGTFTGDTNHGNLIGTVNTNYTEPGITNGQISSSMAGSYVMSISANGAVTGSGIIPLTGQLAGQMKITFQGQKSPSNELTGTWTGTLTVSKIISQSISYDASITSPGSGQFTGTA